jgi:hypothetical protein
LADRRRSATLEPALPEQHASTEQHASVERYASIVDVHVILRREGRILLLRRAGNVYASGQLCLTGVRAGSMAVAC